MESRIRVSPDGRRALLLGSAGSIFSIDLSTRRTDTPRQLASSIRDACFYDNDTCYFISGTYLKARYDSYLDLMTRRQSYRGV